ncbi:MAG: DNA polymerase III subunit gamma/tau [Patescibacteria group bacterium]
MFYTKYRPQNFSEIAKPNDTATALMSQVSKGKTGHAYLFVGPRGTGKTTTARVLAKALNCANLSSIGDPCTKCSACLSIQQGKYLDLIEIDAASNRGIDDIRDLRDKVKLAPSHGEKKIYIIDEVHMLTTEAFNALLKTLEEPPSHVTFILCTTESHKVPETIKSRCQVFIFKRATSEQLVRKLSDIATKEGATNLTSKDFQKIAQMSRGGFRDAETLLQQVIEGELDVVSFVGVGDISSYSSVLNALHHGKPAEAINTLNAIYDSGTDIYIWLTDFIRFVRDILFVKSSVSSVDLTYTSEELDIVRELASEFSFPQLLQYLEALLKTEPLVKTSFISTLPIEICFYSLSTSTSTPTPVSKVNPKTPTVPPKGSEKNFITPSIDESSDIETPEEVTEDGFDLELNLHAQLDSLRTLPDLPNGAADLEDYDTYVPEEGIISLKDVKNSWPKVQKLAAQKNAPLYALLKSAKPLEISGSKLFIEVFYSFHKERLESTKNKLIVLESMQEIYGVRLDFECRLSKQKPAVSSKFESGTLTDYNVVVPGSNQISSADQGVGVSVATSPRADVENAGDSVSMLDMLDGELPDLG